MQCSVRMESDHNCGNNTMKTINSYKNHYKKEANVDSIVEQVASRLRSIEDREGAPTGMPIEQTEAVRRYYAAFPALRKGEESPLQYYLPPPAWCRAPPRAMQSDLAKDWNKSKRFPGKERRNSGHGQKKTRRRAHGLRSPERLPEWVTAGGAWDMDGHDPVREFIRALALDEGYGTADVVDDAAPDAVPDAVPEPARAEPEPDLDLYAAFEAKFDRSLEALWTEPEPELDYRELPIDFAELLASPSDRLWEPPPLTDAVWAPASPPLHARLRPLHLASPRPPPPELGAFALLDGDQLYEALAGVADTLRSLAAINHSRDASGFVEVPPRRRAAPAPPAPPRAPPAPPAPPAPAAAEREDLLTAARTHFRPIRREGEAEGARYADGDTFDIRASPEPVAYRRSESGGAYLGGERYLEYGAGAALPLRFPLRQRDAAAQTDAWGACDCAGAAKKMRAAGGGADELARDWEELLADISAAHAGLQEAPAPPPAPPPDRKRRHSAALRCARQCAHPHARFLPCCALDRPLTR